MASRTPVIVGYDPGTTSAIAVMDTDSNVISVFSRKDLTKAEISRRILSLGVPVIIAADRFPVPSRVEKLAAAFSSRVAYPEDNLSRIQKNRTARKVLMDNGFEKTNQHERDALSAAYHASSSVRPVVRRIRTRLRKLGLETTDLENHVITRVILHRESLRRAMESFYKQ